MAKKKKSRKAARSHDKKDSKKGNAKLIIYLFGGIIAIGVIFIAVQVISMLGNDKVIDDKPPIGYNKYAFRKEGELQFITNDGKDTIQIDIEIASSPQERQLGLMYRDKMEENQGMLFLHRIHGNVTGIFKLPELPGTKMTFAAFA